MNAVDNAFECDQCTKWFHYGCTNLPVYMIYHLAHSDAVYICEVCILSKNESVITKVGEIESIIKSQKALGNPAQLPDTLPTDQQIINQSNVSSGDGEPQPILSAQETVVQPKSSSTDINGHPEQNTNTDTTHQQDKHTPKKRVCRFFAQGTCRHGKRGVDCNFDHPQMCARYTKNGVYGCKKGINCKFFHPKLCRDLAFTT